LRHSRLLRIFFQFIRHSTVISIQPHNLDPDSVLSKPAEGTCTRPRRAMLARVQKESVWVPDVSRIILDIRALSGMESYDPRIRAREDSSYLRPRGHCDPLYSYIYASVKKRNTFLGALRCVRHVDWIHLTQHEVQRRVLPKWQ
jgi:hypothetical protein